jgi:N-acetylmuramic acid 6-phosphate etherase
MDHLLTEARNPASTNLDELTPLELVHLMNAEDAQIAAAVATQVEAIARGIEVIAARLQGGGRLVYIGAGTSGRLGVLDASECPPTFNAPPGQVVGVIAGGHKALTQAVEGAEDHPEFAAQDLAALNVTARDVVVGIATSGRTPYVLGGMHYARGVGAYTIGFSCSPDSELHAAVDLPITVAVGPEVLSGSTRLKAGTATKLVLNMLSTGVMVRLGKTYGNLMVDLRASNNKLRARTNRIVRHLTGVDAETADRLLAECGGELKTALVARMASVTPAEARQRLHEHAGQVRRALGGIGAERHHADLLLGIDGGGTHTVAMLARTTGAGWTVLGCGKAGPSNIHALGATRAQAALAEAIQRAFSAAGLPVGPVARACLGLAGAGRAAEQQAFRDWAARVHLAEHVEITSDVALLPACSPAGWGLAIVAGTGSIAFGATSDGHSARAGGWGSLLGDEGSGYAITVAALRAVMAAADGRAPATLLAERFLHRLELHRPDDLVAAVHGRLDRPAIAALATLVFEAANNGDAVACNVVDAAARDLANTALAVARKLGLLHVPVPLVLAGGVLLTQPGYRQTLLAETTRNGLQPELVTLVEEPVKGAVRLAAMTR